VNAFIRSIVVATSGVTLGVCALFLSPSAASAAGTPAGTAIVNKATSSYTDTAGNAYTSTSNTVTTTVQNAPSLTNVDATVQSTTPGGQLTDVFTLTNTGNGTATFALTAGAEGGTDALTASVPAYVVTFQSAIVGGAVTGCTVLTTTSESCTTIAAANTLLLNNPVAAGGVVTVGAVLNVATGATAGTIAVPFTTITPLSATTTQTVAANAGTAAAATSTAAAASETDNVVSDARMDLQKFGYQPNTAPNTTANIEYVIDVANGGSLPARDLTSVKTLLGSATAGVFISDKLPAFAGTTAVVQAASVATSAAAGYGGTATTLYYSTSATGAAGSWTAFTGTAALPATATYIGVLISGNPSSELGTNGNTTGNGVVAAARSAVTLTFYVSPPTGTGAGNLNTYINEANGVVGGDQPNLTPDSAVTNPPQNVNGPNIPANTTDSVTAIDSGTQGILYPTPAIPGVSLAAGSSNAVGNMAVIGGGVLNGPFGVPGATGSYNGIALASNNNDVSAVAFTPAGFTPTNTSATGTVAGNALGAPYTQPIANTLQNTGNSVDNITVVVTAPTGFGVQIYASTAAGVATGPVLAGTTTTNTATYTFANVPSGATTDTANQGNYVVVYTVPATATAFTAYDTTITATSGNLPLINNTTHNDVIPGGPIALTKSVALDPLTCTGGNAVPGCIMTYTIAYNNNAAVALACPVTPPTAASIPTYLAGFYAKGLTISENGATAPNTWGATYTNSAGTFKNTTGLNAAATDTNLASTFTGNTVASYAFTDLVGGAATYVLSPGCNGTLTFRVTVNTQ